jgi:hypothetical protein
VSEDASRDGDSGDCGERGGLPGSSPRWLTVDAGQKEREKKKDNKWI